MNRAVDQKDHILSSASAKAIAELGTALSFDDDVRPALTAARIEPVEAKAFAQGGSEFFAFRFPGTRDHISETLAALDLADPNVVSRVLRVIVRIARVFAAGTGVDKAKLIRLANALGDDADRIESDPDLGDDKSVGGSAYAVVEGQVSGKVGKVTINKAAIAKMMRDIQREFDRHPIQIPVSADTPELRAAGGATTVYNGPVIMGDANNAQLAWGNNTVHQTQNVTEQIAPGFEVIAQAVAKTLEGLAAVGLNDEDRQEAEAVATEILEEVTNAQPNQGKLKRALMALKGFLAPIATGVSAGAGEGAQEWARTAIKQLGVPF